MRHTVAGIESESTAVQSIVNLLLNSEFKGEYQLNITEDDRVKTLVLRGSEEKLIEMQKALQHALSTPTAIRELIGYQLTGASSQGTDAQTPVNYNEMPPLPENTFEAGLKMLTNLFPVEIGDGFVFRPADIFDETKDAHAKKGVLFSKEATKQRTKQRWELCVEDMLELFDGVPVARLRTALESAMPLDAIKSEDSDGQLDGKIAKGLLLECFGTVDNRESGAKRLYFNFTKLFQLLYPPKLDIADSCITINLAHLTMYMKQLVSEGFLLTISDDQKNLHPVFWEGLSTIAKPLNLLFSLDLSGSMSGYETAIRDNINSVLVRLRQTIPADQLGHAKVSFQTFNSTVSPVKQYNLADVNGIETFLSGLYSGGATALYRAITGGLQYISSYHDKNNVMIVLTDGNDGEGGYQQMISTINQVNNDDNLDITVFTLGLGSVNEQVLSDIAQQTATTYFPINNLSELQQRLIENIQRMMFQHRIIKLLVGQQSFTVPVPHNGSFTQAQVTIPLQASGVELTVDGDQYVVSLEAPAAQSQLSSSAAAGLQQAVAARARAGGTATAAVLPVTVLDQPQHDELEQAGARLATFGQ